MNGRVYDPTLGRFIQADPHIQAPSDSQSLNRYSYVKNNPLSYTDPTGYFFKKLFKGLKKLWNKIRPFVGTILNIIVAIKCFGVCTAGQWALGAAEAGFWGAAATGGNPIKGALMGAFSSYAFGFIGANFDVGTFGNIVGNGVVGGIMSELQGGNFGHGFIAAGFSAAFKPLVNTIGGDNASGIFARASAAAIIGGTASKLSGGKFANGAISGAAAQIFNGEKNRTYRNKYIKYRKMEKAIAHALRTKSDLATEKRWETGELANMHYQTVADRAKISWSASIIYENADLTFDFHSGLGVDTFYYAGFGSANIADFGVESTLWANTNGDIKGFGAYKVLAGSPRAYVITQDHNQAHENHYFNLAGRNNMHVIVQFANGNVNLYNNIGGVKTSCSYVGATRC